MAETMLVARRSCVAGSLVTSSGVLSSIMRSEPSAMSSVSRETEFRSSMTTPRGCKMDGWFRLLRLRNSRRRSATACSRSESTKNSIFFAAIVIPPHSTSYALPKLPCPRGRSHLTLLDARSQLSGAGGLMLTADSLAVELAPADEELAPRSTVLMGRAAMGLPRTTGTGELELAPGLLDAVEKECFKDDSKFRHVESFRLWQISCGVIPWAFGIIGSAPLWSKISRAPALPLQHATKRDVAPSADTPLRGVAPAKPDSERISGGAQIAAASCHAAHPPEPARARSQPSRNCCSKLRVAASSCTQGVAMPQAGKSLGARAFRALLTVHCTPASPVAVLFLRSLDGSSGARPSFTIRRRRFACALYWAHELRAPDGTIAYAGRRGGRATHLSAYGATEGRVCVRFGALHRLVLGWDSRRRILAAVASALCWQWHRCEAREKAKPRH
eukprot:scaffold43702_cov69-Phaeocystis_antarctica.AAC.2